MASLFSEMMKKAAKRAEERATDSSPTSSSSSGEAGRGGGRRSFGGVEFILQMSPDLTKQANEKAIEKAKAYGKPMPRPCLVGLIIGFVGSSTGNSFVCERGNAAVLLCNDNNGSKIYRVGDKYKVTLWGQPVIDPSGIAVIRPYANKQKYFLKTTPNKFSGYREYLTFDAVSETSQVQIVPADAWLETHAYDVAKYLGCTLRPLHPDVVPTTDVWTLYADHESDGRYSMIATGPSPEELAERGRKLQERMDGLTDAEREVLSKAYDAETKQLKREAFDATKNMRESAQYEAWKNAIPVGHPLAQWRRSFWPLYGSEYVLPGGGRVGATPPMIDTHADDAFIMPSSNFFTNHSDMPYNTVPAQREGEQATKAALVPHVCIEITQDVIFSAPSDPSSPCETQVPSIKGDIDALTIKYTVWSGKLAPLLSCYMPHTLFNLASAHLADFAIHAMAKTDIGKTLNEFPSRAELTAHSLTGRPYSQVHMDVYTLFASPINFALTHGYELNTRAAIHLTNMFLADIGEKPGHPGASNTSAYNRTNMAVPTTAKCNDDYRRALKYISGLWSKNSNHESVQNLFEVGGKKLSWSESTPALDDESAFFLVPARAFADGEFGVVNNPRRKDTIRALYRKVYVDREADLSALEQIVDGISKWVLDDDPDKFALPPVFMEDGWATNFLLLEIPRTHLYPSDAVFASSQETVAKYTDVLDRAHKDSPHKGSRFFAHDVEAVFDELADRGFVLNAHRDVVFHKNLISGHFGKRGLDDTDDADDGKRQCTAPADSMADDADLDADMLAAESALQAATQADALHPAQEQTIPVEDEDDSDLSEDENDSAEACSST